MTGHQVTIDHAIHIAIQRAREKQNFFLALGVIKRVEEIGKCIPETQIGRVNVVMILPYQNQGKCIAETYPG